MEYNTFQDDINIDLNGIEVSVLSLLDTRGDDDTNYLSMKNSKKRYSNNRYISVPWIFFDKFSEYGGINTFIVLMYFLKYRNTKFEVRTNLKIICEWARITRNKLDTSKQLVSSLSDFIKVPISLNEAKLTTTLDFKVNLFKTPYFRVNSNYLDLLNEKNGFEMFTIVCVLLNITEKRDYCTGYTSNYHQAIISLKQLGKRTCLSPNSVSKYLKQLEELKYISTYRKFNVDKGMYDTTEYTVLNRTGRKYYLRAWKNK